MQVFRSGIEVNYVENLLQNTKDDKIEEITSEVTKSEINNYCSGS